MKATWHPSKHPSVQVERAMNKTNFISFAFYDVDSPHPYDRTKTPYLMFLRVNASSALSQDVIDYEAPTSKIPHSYQLLVFTHKNPIDGDLERERLRASGRQSWKCDEFLERNECQVKHRRFFMHAE